MATGQSQTSERAGVGAQLVGDENFRHKALLLELVVVGSDLDVACVTGVLDAIVSVPAAKPLLERPAVEGIAPFPRYNRSQNDLHGVPLATIRTAIGLSTIRPNWHDAVLGLGHANN